MEDAVETAFAVRAVLTVEFKAPCDAFCEGRTGGEGIECPAGDLHGRVEVPGVGAGCGDGIENAGVVRVRGEGLGMPCLAQDLSGVRGGPGGGGEAPDDIVPEVEAVGTFIEDAPEPVQSVLPEARDPLVDGKRHGVFNGNGGHGWKDEGLAGEPEGSVPVRSVQGGGEAAEEHRGTEGGIAGAKRESGAERLQGSGGIAEGKFETGAQEEEVGPGSQTVRLGE